MSRVNIVPTRDLNESFPLNYAIEVGTNFLSQLTASSFAKRKPTSSLANTISGSQWLPIKTLSSSISSLFYPLLHSPNFPPIPRNGNVRFYPAKPPPPLHLTTKQQHNLARRPLPSRTQHPTQAARLHGLVHWLVCIRKIHHRHSARAAFTAPRSLCVQAGW